MHHPYKGNLIKIIMKKCNPTEILKEHGLKLTKQRLSLLEEIINFHSVFTAQDLHERVDTEMDMVTVYRIINLLREHGIIREILTGDEIKTYEMSCIHNPIHPHFQCSKCRKIKCLKKISPDEIEILTAKFPELKITGVSLYFTGLCDKCK